MQSVAERPPGISDIGPTNPYFVLMAGKGEDKHLYYLANHNDEVVFFVFSSQVETELFLNKRINRTQAYMDFVEWFSGDVPDHVKDEVWTAGAVYEVETMATLAASVDADLMVLDAGREAPWPTMYFSK